jgi:site-specific DNA-cytosine methylase
MKVLELFKGSGSITKFFLNDKVEVVSLDIEKNYNPTICCDIMCFDYKKYKIGYFDIIWASPECKLYSSFQYIHVGKDKKYKNKQVLLDKQKIDSKFINKTIEIIEYLQPKYYFIENPLNSSIWKYIDNLKYLDTYIIVDYCYFGYDYKKPTKILTNKNLVNKRCGCKNHKIHIGATRKNNQNKINQKKYNLLYRYSIPQKLLKYLFE